MTYITRDRDQETGYYEVRDSRNGSRLGWVQWAGEWRHWRAICGYGRCGDNVGVGGTRPRAARILHDHWAVEHR